MRGTIDQEKEILTKILSFRDDPVKHVMYCFPWGRKGTLFEKFKGPRPWQMRELERIRDHVRENRAAYDLDLPLDVYQSCKSSGRGPGKTALLAMVAHWCMSVRIGAPIIVSANTEAQMRAKTFPEFAVWFGASINTHWFEVDAMRITPAAWLQKLVNQPPEAGGLGIDPKYWYCAAQTWNADNENAFAGAHNPYGMCVMFDEAAGIPDGIWNVTEGFFTEINPYRFWFGMSQMRNRQGRFHDIFYDKNHATGWYSETLSTRGMEGIDQNVIRKQILRYGEDSDFVRVEIDGLPPKTEEGQFIPTENVETAMHNMLTLNPGTDKLILGVDPAPRGRTTWQFRQGRNARDCCGPKTHGEWQGKDNVQIAQAVLDLDAAYKPDAICIDFGMGTGVIDILKRKLPFPGILHEVRFGMIQGQTDEFKTNGTRLWAKVRDWLPGAMIPMDDGEKGSLSYEATNRQWKWSGGKEDTKKILESKEELKKRGVDSPDKMDSLACTHEVDNPPRRPQDNGPGPQRIAHGTGDYEFTI